jgi:hypothetical protein
VSSKRTSIYISEGLREILGLPDPAVSVTKRLTRIADRYKRILDHTHLSGRFSTAEWDLLRDLLSNVWHEPAATIRGLHVSIEDAIRLGRPIGRWMVDSDSLLTKLRALTYVEEVAIVETIEQWRIGKHASTITTQR